MHPENGFTGHRLNQCDRLQRRWRDRAAAPLAFGFSRPPGPASCFYADDMPKPARIMHPKHPQPDDSPRRSGARGATVHASLEGPSFPVRSGCSVLAVFSMAGTMNSLGEWADPS